MSRAAEARAPVYTATYDLSVWVLGHFNARTDTLSAEISRLTLRLLDCVVLALKDRERLEHLDEADRRLLALRQRLRLANSQALLDERQTLHALGRCNEVGRQLGGWLKHLEASQ